MGAARVFFSHQTAFHILRAIPPNGRVAVRGDMAVLPDRPPSRTELAEAVLALEAACPGLRLENPVHVLVRDSSHRRLSRDCEEHVVSVPLAGKPYCRVAHGVYAAAPALALVLGAAREQRVMETLELAYELCGTYRTRRTGADAAYNVAPLASVRELRDFASCNRSLGGASKVVRILPYMADGSASPRETKQALVLGLPHRHGGYGLGIPRMNYEVKASPSARAITGKRCFRCDLCWPEARLDVEYQSRYSHEGEAARLSDSRRANALMAMGWTVVGVTNEELDSLAATDAIANTIRRHLGKRAQVRTPDYYTRKLKLRRQLGLPVGYA